MQKLYKKDVKQFISIFVKNLDIVDYGDARSKIEKYLKENKIECIITSTEKIVYAYGKKVEQYLNSELSNTLKEQIKDIHLSSVRSRVFLCVKLHGLNVNLVGRSSMCEIL